MSKMINIPGTTDFIPTDDIISIKIKGKVTSREVLVIPEDANGSFGVTAGSYAELEVVTTYVGDAVEDEDDAETKTEDKVSSVTWYELPLFEQTMVTPLESSVAYLGMDSDDQKQINIRIKKYLSYLEHLQLKQELTDKINNLNPNAVQVDDEATIEEEEETNSSLGITTLVPLSSTPDEAKLREVNAFLEETVNSEEKQLARIEYIEKRFSSSKEELTIDDGYKFLRVLKERGVNTSSHTALSNALEECLAEIRNILD